MGVLDDLDRAGKHEDREPFIMDGIHELAVKDYKEHKSKKNGDGVKVTLVVIKSSNPLMKPGSVVCQGWYPNHPPRFVGDTGQDDLNKIVDFMIKARGIPEGADQLAKGKDSVRYCLAPQGVLEQRLRGVRIVATGVKKPPSAAAAAAGKTGWTDVTWTHIPGQTAEEIKAMRARVEQVPDIQPQAAGAPPAAQPTTAAAPPAANPFEGAPAAPPTQAAPPPAPPKADPGGW